MLQKYQLNIGDLHSYSLYNYLKKKIHSNNTKWKRLIVNYSSDVLLLEYCFVTLMHYITRFYYMLSLENLVMRRPALIILTHISYQILRLPSNYLEYVNSIYLYFCL